MSEPSLQIAIKLLDDGLPTPGYAHHGDAGADLRAREAV
ncbi:dUTP diphosphatase, partial [Glutamicibacter creatinolyticus]